MSGERCGYLISVAMANRLDEVWLSLHPVLLFTYMMQYMPGLAMRCVCVCVCVCVIYVHV